jgi:hypothetical protein
MTPAEIVIERFGGIRPAAKALGISPTTVLRWSQPREKGGTGGNIPPKNWGDIESAAKRLGIRMPMAKVKVYIN